MGEKQKTPHKIFREGEKQMNGAGQKKQKKTPRGKTFK